MTRVQDAQTVGTTTKNEDERRRREEEKKKPNWIKSRIIDYLIEPRVDVMSVVDSRYTPE